VKVSFVALNYAPSHGGAQELIRRVAEGLVARGHDVEVLTTDALRSPNAADPGHIPVADEVIGGVRVRRFAVPKPLASGLRSWRVGSGVVRQRLRRTGPISPSPWILGPYPPRMVRAVSEAMRTRDVVVGCSAPFATLLMSGWARRGAQACRVSMPLLHVNEVPIHPAILRTLRRSDLVVAATEFEAGVGRTAGVAPGRVRVISPGTDAGDRPATSPAEARERLGLPQRPTVGFIGRLAAYKGIDTLYAAAPLLWADHPDTTLLVAGSPSGWSGYRSPALEAQAGDRLVVKERFADHERALLLAACDVVVHPSHQESFGMAAIEAWAAERPVVVADIPSVRSFVDPGRNVEMIDPGDHVALARVLGDLLDDPDRRARLAAAGRAEVEARFDWEQIGDAWDALVTGTVAGGA
jgi:glycosyltransferase involved in cell wall biosynthesis